MSIQDFLFNQPSPQKEILSRIHNTIEHADKKTIAAVGTMMGKEMILYTNAGLFKYGLSAAKKYMSLHLMPIYGSPALHAKYKNLLSKATFQKGCINFKKEEDMPAEIVQQLIEECAAIDLPAMMEQFKTKKG